MVAANPSAAENSVDDNPWRAQEKMRKEFIDTLQMKLLRHCRTVTDAGIDFNCVSPRAVAANSTTVPAYRELFTDQGWQEYVKYAEWQRERLAKKLVSCHRSESFGVLRHPASAPGTALFHSAANGVATFETDMNLMYSYSGGTGCACVTIECACDGIDIRVDLRTGEKSDFKIEHFNVALSDKNKRCDWRREPDLSHMGQEPQILGDAPPPLQ